MKAVITAVALVFVFAIVISTVMAFAGATVERTIRAAAAVMCFAGFLGAIAAINMWLRRRDS